MVEFFRNLLIGICALIVMWGTVKIERIYQFPFFMASMVISFILPQVSALINNPGVVTEKMLIPTLAMACLCTSMCWIGYHLPPNLQLLRRLQTPLDDKKLLQAGIFLTTIGWIFSIFTAQAAIQIEAGKQWTGPATIFAFFAQVIYLGFAILLMQLLSKPSVINITGTVIAGLPIIQTILAGRRQPTMTFLIIIGLAFWYNFKLAPPKWLVLLSIFLGAYIIPLVGNLRGGFWSLIFQQDWETLKTSAELSYETLQKGGTLELRNATLVIDAATVSGRYEYGAGYWNAFVFQYFPGQIFGYDLKQSLQFDLQREENLSVYGYTFPSGTTWTGIGDSYLQFGYFGALVFGLMANVFKILWIASYQQKSIIATLLMMSLISPAMVGITHGTERFLQEFIFQIIVVILVVYYCGIKFQRSVIGGYY